ncbi:permease [Christiangramia crocea]|uniref:Permease n=1 Tax=Christiangramia crocea TaxID=2904124 RepID=A0A9X2A7L8_9FLAO|nr:permease [Gramella crocea]MCG9970938.1 permease [Gramella crocea]
MEQIFRISQFVVDSFIHIWPYLVITIPIAVFVNVSGVSKRIHRIVDAKPLVSVLLATIIGAFSPFCSCGVIPVIASLLIGGVPLAPVMSFWIASPSMDPEIFFLSTATIGWELSVWRLAATLCISLLSGYITHLCMVKGWLGTDILKKDMTTSTRSPMKIAAKKAWETLKVIFTAAREAKRAEVQLVANGNNTAMLNCCVSAPELQSEPASSVETKETKTCSSKTCSLEKASIWNKVFRETVKATLMVTKFMTLAFVINALIQFYVPQEPISNLLGGNGLKSIITASLVGIPFYTSNLTALPLIGGLLELGMSEGAALAFLISGPITTLPAMAAVWGIVRKKIFIMYVSFALTGSLIFGILFNLIN